MAVSLEHLRSIVYFWQERGDLERMVDWKAIENELAEDHPEIVKAWREYQTAKRTLNAVVRQLNSEIDAREDEESQW